MGWSICCQLLPPKAEIHQVLLHFWSRRSVIIPQMAALHHWLISQAYKSNVWTCGLFNAILIISDFQWVVRSVVICIKTYLMNIWMTWEAIVAQKILLKFLDIQCIHLVFWKKDRFWVIWYTGFHGLCLRNRNIIPVLILELWTFCFYVDTHYFWCFPRLYLLIIWFLMCPKSKY